MVPPKISLFSSKNLDRDLWRQLLEGSVYANLYQDDDWATFRETEREYSTFCVAEDEGQPVGIRVWKRKIRVGFVLESAGGPLYFPESELLAKRLLERVLPLVRTGCMAGSFTFSPLFNSRVITGFDGINPNRVTFAIDLTKSADKLWNGISKSARWSVRTAERRGIIIKESDDFEQWIDFHKIHLEESSRKGYEHIALSASGIRWIYDVLRPKKKCALLVALLDNTVVAGSLLYVSRNTLHWVRNASNPRYLAFQPNDSLAWSAIMLGKNRGVSLLDLFGATKGKNLPGAGIYQFKSKWGGIEVSDPVYMTGKAYSIASRLQRSSPLARSVIDFFNASIVRA